MRSPHWQRQVNAPRRTTSSSSTRCRGNARRGEVANWVLTPHSTADEHDGPDATPIARRTCGVCRSPARPRPLTWRRGAQPVAADLCAGLWLHRRATPARLRTYTLGDNASEDATVENQHHCLTFDTETGGVLRWHDKRLLHHEWVNNSAGYSLNTFVHEEVADLNHPWPRHRLFR